jgi:ATP-dependent DNA ligase
VDERDLLRVEIYNSLSTVLERSGKAIGFIEPCLPSSAKATADRSRLADAVKHDGFRIMARQDATRVRLFTCNGHDISKRFL